MHWCPNGRKVKMFRTIAIAAACVLLSCSAIAKDSAKLVGTWKLVSFVTEFQDGSPSRPVLGPNAKGYLVHTPDGRQIVFIEADGRKPAKADEERIGLFNTMISWTGIYRFEGDKYVLKVDGAWNPAITGTERVSTVKIDGDRIHFIAPWAPNPILPGAPVTRGLTVWERVK